MFTGPTRRCAGRRAGGRHALVCRLLPLTCLAPEIAAVLEGVGVPRGGADARPCQGLTKVPRHIPRLAFRAPRPRRRHSASSTAPPTRRHQPAADVDQLGEKTLAMMRPVPLDHLAAHFDPGYEGLEGGQRHRAACYLLTPPPERLVQLRGIDAVQAD
jgi:hypothetical protein